MTTTLQNRLNAILPRVTEPEFLQTKGLGNEIGFWIFDYPSESERMVRCHLKLLAAALESKHSTIAVTHINLFTMVCEYLQERNFLDRSFKIQKVKGNDALTKALAGPLDMQRLAPYIVETSQAADQDLILLSGVGSAWPLLRGHDLLNNLHALLGHKPVVLFFPGSYDGQALSLFGRVPSNNYYRAFKLIP